MIHHAKTVDIYECDAGCGSLVKIKKGDPPPDGYFLTIRRVNSGRRNRRNYKRTRIATPYFCDITCFKSGVQFHSYDDISDEEVFE